MSFLGDVFGGLFGGGESSKVFEQAIGQQGSIVKAMLNPQGKLFQRLVAYEQDRIQFDLAESLKDLMTMNRREGGRAGPLLNPERRDESIAKASTWGMAMAPFAAREAARDYLSRAATANMGIVQGTAQLYGQQQAYNRNFGASALEALLTGGQKLLDGGQSQNGQYAGLTINVNGSGKLGKPTLPWLS